MKLLKRTLAITLISMFVIMSGTAAMAGTSTFFCSSCNKNTLFRENCSKKSAGNSSYRSHTVSGKVCNYYISYYYNGNKCTICGNQRTSSVKHEHKRIHEICADQLNLCPF